MLKHYVKGATQPERLEEMKAHFLFRDIEEKIPGQLRKIKAVQGDVSQIGESNLPSGSDILFLKHACSIIRQSSNPVCGFYMMEQDRLCAVWPRENWLGSSMNHIQRVGGLSEYATVML